MLFGNFLILILNHLVRIVWKLSLQGRFFFQITNYQGFQNKKVNLYEIFTLGLKFKLKFEILQNSEVWSFELTRLCCATHVLVYSHYLLFHVLISLLDRAGGLSCNECFLQTFLE
jgi:hypothetical protein